MIDCETRQSSDLNVEAQSARPPPTLLVRWLALSSLVVGFILFWKQNRTWLCRGGCQRRLMVTKYPRTVAGDKHRLPSEE